MASLDYGSAIRMFRADGTLDPDLDGPMLTGPRVALEAVAVTLFTLVGSNPYDRNMGVRLPLPALINYTGSDASLRRIEAEYAAAARTQVEMVGAARFAFSRTSRGLALTGAVTTSSGLTAPLVASVADAIKVLFPTASAA